MPLRQTPQGIFLHLLVLPKSKANKIDGIKAMPNGNVLVVRVTAPPDKGKANEAVIEYLAKEFKLAKSSLELVSGETTRYKRLSITSKIEVIEQAIKQIQL